MRGSKILLLCAVSAALLFACADTPPPEVSPPGAGEELISIEGTALGWGEVAYLMGNAIDEYLLYRDIDWEGTIGDVPVRRYFLNRTLELAVAAHAVRIKAAELGYELTDEEEGAIDWEIAMEADYRGGREAFLEELEDAGLTEELYRFYSCEAPVLGDKMLTDLFGPDGPYAPDDGVLRAYYLGNYIPASYIFLSGTDVYGETLAGEQLETQRSVAEALRRRAAGGEEDFFEMVAEYGQEYLMSLSPEGLPVPLGLFGTGFDAALSALAPGGISEVVTTEEGFYIILRLPEDPEWFEENREAIWDSCAFEAFSEKVAEWGEGLNVTVSDEYYRLDPLEMIAAG